MLGPITVADFSYLPICVYGSYPLCERVFPLTCSTMPHAAVSLHAAFASPSPRRLAAVPPRSPPFQVPLRTAAMHSLQTERLYERVPYSIAYKQVSQVLYARYNVQLEALYVPYLFL